MKKNNALTLKPVRTIVIIILIAFVLILACFISLREYAAKRDYEDKILLNLYGKQRMYTQSISKDAGLIYTFLLNQNANNNDLYIIENGYRIDDIRESLRNSKQSFLEIFEATQSGYLTWDSYELNFSGFISKASSHIEDIKNLWLNFDNAIMIILEADEINSEVTEAALYINNHNLELLDYSEQIQEIILNESIKSSGRMEMLFRVLIVLFSAITIIALFHLVRFIILPFNQLYQGLSQIGLSEIPVKPGFPTKKKVIPMVNEISDIFLKIEDLISLIQNMNNNSSFTEILDFINTTFSKIIPYNYIGIALLSDDKTQLSASYGVSDGLVLGLPENLMGLSFELNETSLEELIQSGSSRIINDLEAYAADKPKKTYNQIILNAGIRASITLPLKVSGKPVGIIFFSSMNKNVYHEGHLNFLETLANSIAISFYQTTYIDNIIYSSVLALAKLAEARDSDTGEHLERMKTYSRIIAETLHENDMYANQVTWEFINNIERYSPLHDIGKVGVADSILQKPGNLTKEEFEEMKKHALYGAEVLRYAEQNMERQGHSLFGLGIEITEGHHEKWDGSGYPYGRKGLEIPLSARIVAIADVFDALTSRRPYKEPFSPEESFKIIEEGKGKHFDPDIVDLVMANKYRLKKAYKNFATVPH
ncbi:MAG: HD domain-containing protein [Anaerolineaceae bacterium]|nr:MAG: HD domain-containing protein [Anaerolineaceae bacterium]